MITSIILNWARPQNVVKIVREYDRDLISHCFVWDNAGSLSPFLSERPDGLPDWVTNIQSSRDLSLYTRFLIGILSPTPCVLYQDDDIQLPSDTIQALHNAWLAQPRLIHGIFGRNPKPDGSYAQDVRGDAQASIVLTRALIVSREYLPLFFQYLPLFEEVQQTATPVGNGEDILLSYVVRRHNGNQKHRVYSLPINELPAPQAIHGRIGWDRHCAHRTTLLRLCEHWINS